MRRRFIIYSVFLDVKNRYFDIKKSIPFLDIIFENRFLDVKKWGLVFLYQNFEFFLYHKVDFYIKKLIFFIKNIS